ncbi:MAG: penicillin-binding transpeptidase domain-containing protein [Myxococcaceae bacterium]
MSAFHVPRPILLTVGTLGLLGLCVGVFADADAGTVESTLTVAHAPVGVPGENPLDAIEADAALDFEVPRRLEDPPIARATPLPAELDLLSKARPDANGRLVLGTGDQTRTLTVDPELQAQLTRILQSYETPFAAVVAIEPSTGRVLAMAEHSHAQPTLRGLPVKAVFPAASIFKIVTAAALLEAGVGPEDEECSQGGLRTISLKHLKDSRGDRECHSLSRALAMSANAVFAKMTVKHLTAQRLLRAAELFGFNRPIDFPIPVEPSLIAVPEEPLALARTGAGFGDAFLSPLHGAVLAAVAANGGVWRAPVLFEDQAPAPAGERVISEAHAAALTEMMSETVTQGTARRVFRERGYRVPGAVGKTGSLADKRPFRDYSWFVGFAPRDNPKIAVAAVVVNEPKWRIRATWVGREALRLGLDQVESVER